MARKIKQTYDLYPTRGDNSSTTFYLPAEDADGNPVGMTADQINDRATKTICLFIDPALDVTTNLPIGDTLPPIVIPYNFTLTGISCRMNQFAPTTSSLVIDLLYGTTLSNTASIMSTYPLTIAAGYLYDDGTATLSTTSLSQYGFLVPYIVSGNPAGTGQYPRIYLEGYKT